MTLATKERETYSSAWSSIDDYATYSPGEKYLPLFLQMIGDRPVRGGDRGLVLDAGCGSGKGALALKAAGFHVHMCDLTNEGLVPEAREIGFSEQVLWKPIWTPYNDPFDFAYCCDVLEHLPPQFTMLVVDRLLDATLNGQVFISVCNVQDISGVWIGKALHQTVQPFTWWRDSFRELANVVEARDLIDNSVFLLERK